MISQEILGRYPYFACLNDEQQKEIARVANEFTYDRGTTLFEEGQPVDALHFLLEGAVDLYYTASADPHDQQLICEISPGEPFGVSALIEPYTLTATARVAAPSRVLKINAAQLRAISEEDATMGFALMKKVARVAMERLHYTRLQLAVARA
ncbi:MAG: cyclic nucleotide-binding domain-containing protein [Chloroflexi bacterium]|nr:cyclic nucleotide-binding domain-containing protein [Chloroflexota bacterium]